MSLVSIVFLAVVILLAPHLSEGRANCYVVFMVFMVLIASAIKAMA